MFARFDENPAMTPENIKETKRYGRTHGRTDGRTDALTVGYFLGPYSVRKRSQESVSTQKIPL